MRFIPLIIFICLLSQGCSTKSNLPINQPSSSIPSFAPATIEDATVEQAISLDDLDKPQIEASDVVDAQGEQLEVPEAEDQNGEIKTCLIPVISCQSKNLTGCRRVNSPCLVKHGRMLFAKNWLY